MERYLRSVIWSLTGLKGYFVFSWVWCYDKNSYRRTLKSELPSLCFARIDLERPLGKGALHLDLLAIANFGIN